jgi:hypothetical protein
LFLATAACSFLTSSKYLSSARASSRSTWNTSALRRSLRLGRERTRAESSALGRRYAGLWKKLMDTRSGLVSVDWSAG